MIVHTKVKEKKIKYAQKCNKYSTLYIYDYPNAVDILEENCICAVFEIIGINNLLLFRCLRLRKRYNNDFMQ